MQRPLSEVLFLPILFLSHLLTQQILVREISHQLPKARHVRAEETDRLLGVNRIDLGAYLSLRIGGKKWRTGD